MRFQFRLPSKVADSRIVEHRFDRFAFAVASYSSKAMGVTPSGAETLLDLQDRDSQEKDCPASAQLLRGTKANRSAFKVDT
jgi:hypothetical protein